MSGQYSIALSFDTDDPMFARGVEVGRLWERLNADPGEPVVQQVHGINAEMCIRLAEATGRPFEAEVEDETWIIVRYGAKRE